MFPETDEISNILSDTVMVLFKRRLVDRVLRLWIEIYRVAGGFRAATKSSPQCWAKTGQIVS
jgi:hypothetical protein